MPKQEILPPISGQGRTLTYTDQAGQLLCEWIAEGNSLTSFCKMHKLSATAIYNWLDKVPAFAEAYQKARLVQADTLFNQVLDDAHGIEDINRARLVVQTKQWAAGKLSPKYNDKIVHQGDAKAPINIVLTKDDQSL